MFWKKEKKEKGKAIIYINDCNGCGDCIRKCPQQAIELYSICEEKYARVSNPDDCTGCGKCARVCDYGAIDIMEVVLCRTY